MIHEFRILVRAERRKSRRSIAKRIDECLKSTGRSMELPFKVQDIILSDNDYLKNLREMKIGSSMKISTGHRVAYASYAKALSLDIVFRHHSEGWLKLYVIDTDW